MLIQERLEHIIDNLIDKELNLFRNNENDQLLAKIRLEIEKILRETSEHPIEPTHLYLCDQDRLILKPNQKYVFTVNENCSKCVDLEKEGRIPLEEFPFEFREK